MSSPASSAASPPPKRKRGPAANAGPPKKRGRKSKAQLAAEQREREEASQTPAPAPISAAPTPAPAPAFAQDEDDEDEEEHEDEEDDLLDQHVEEDLLAEEERHRQREGLAVLINQHFTEEQRERYEHYRRSGFRPATVKKLLSNILQQSISPNVVLAFRGLSKVFVGEIVEIARKVQSRQQQTGPLLPEHIREAYRIWNKEKSDGGGAHTKLFIK